MSARAYVSLLPVVLLLSGLLAPGATRAEPGASKPPAQSRGPDAGSDARPLEAAAGAVPAALDPARPDAAAEPEPAWSPPPCEQMAVELGALPPASDAEAWRERLAAAGRRIREAQRELGVTDAVYARSLDLHEPRAGARAAIVRDRDAARQGYGESRCALPRLVEAARRSGVSEEILRPWL